MSDNVLKMPRRGRVTPREFLQAVIDDHGADLQAVVVLGFMKDGNYIDGWMFDKEFDSVVLVLGALEALKLDFASRTIDKRDDDA